MLNKEDTIQSDHHMQQNLGSGMLEKMFAPSPTTATTAKTD